MEKNNPLYQQVLKEIETYQTIIIHRDTNPSVDTYGSQLGLKEILQINYPKKKIYAVGTNLNYLNAIGGMDDLEADDYRQALVLVLGTSNHSMVDDHRWRNGKKIVEISHQPPKNKMGNNLEVIMPNKAACSELVAELVIFWNLKISARAAKILMFGLVDATSGFKVPSLSANTFDIFAKLATIFPNINEIFETLRLINPGDLWLKRYIGKHARTSPNLVTWIFVSLAKQEKWDLESHRVEAMMNHLLDLSPGEFTAMFIERPDKTIFMLLHSLTRPAYLMVDRYRGWGTFHTSEAVLKNKKEMKEILKELENEVV